MQKKPDVKAQGALEYLLIIGAAILIVAIVILAISGALGGAKTDANSTQKEVGSSLDTLREVGGNKQLPLGLSAITFSNLPAGGMTPAQIFENAPANTYVSWGANQASTNASGWTGSSAPITNGVRVEVRTPSLITIKVAYSPAVELPTCTGQVSCTAVLGVANFANEAKEMCETLDWCKFTYSCQTYEYTTCNDVNTVQSLIPSFPLRTQEFCTKIGCGFNSLTSTCTGANSINCTNLAGSECDATRSNEIFNLTGSVGFCNVPSTTCTPKAAQDTGDCSTLNITNQTACENLGCTYGFD